MGLKNTGCRNLRSHILFKDIFSLHDCRKKPEKNIKSCLLKVTEGILMVRRWVFTSSHLSMTSIFPAVHSEIPCPYGSFPSVLLFPIYPQLPVSAASKHQNINVCNYLNHEYSQKIKTRNCMADNPHTL